MTNKFSEEIIWFFGDIFHTAENDAETYVVVQELFKKLLEKNQVFILRGNHDYNSREDALDIFREIGVRVYTDLEVIVQEDYRILVVPYISRAILMAKKYPTTKDYILDYVKDKDFTFDYVFSHHTIPEVAVGEKGFSVREVGFEVTGHMHIGREGFDQGYLNLGTPYQCRRDEEGKKSAIYKLFDKQFIRIEPEGDYLEYHTFDVSPDMVDLKYNDNWIYTINIHCTNDNLTDAKILEKELREKIKLIRSMKIFNSSDELSILEPSQVEGKNDQEIFTELCKKRNESNRILEKGLQVIGEVSA